MLAFNKIPIVHIYGTLGHFPWDNKGRKIDYSYEIDSECISAMAKEINIMSSERETEELQTAHKLLKEAENIYFLGFGYDKLNLDRLNIIQYGKGKRMVGTRYGINDKELEDIQYYINVQSEARSQKTTYVANNEITFCKNNEDIMHLLRDYIIFR